MIEVSHNFYLVGLSYAIAVFGSYVALQLAIHIPTAKGSALWGWLSGSSIALGAGAIWSMHFIGMLAYDMPVAVHYDIPLTIASLILAIIVAGIGLFIVGRSQGSLIKLLVAGIAGGIGVSGMHYMGMAAMNMPVDMNFDYSIVALSIIIGIAAATAALWLAFNLRGSFQRFGSAYIMGLAVCGMHYTGMSAVSMMTNHKTTYESPYFSPEITALIIFATASVLLITLLLIAYFKTKSSTKQEDELDFDLELEFE